MGDTPSIMKFMTTFVFGENARKLTGYLDTELRNVEIYQSFRRYKYCSDYAWVMGILVLVSFICVLLRVSPCGFLLIQSGSYWGSAVCVQQTDLRFSGAGVSAASAGGVVIFVIICDFVYDDKQYAYRQRVQLTKY